MSNQIKLIFAFLLLIIILFFQLSCSTTEPPDDPEPVLKLELEDVSCTEAWITLTASTYNCQQLLT